MTIDLILVHIFFSKVFGRSRLAVVHLEQIDYAQTHLQMVLVIGVIHE